VADEGQEMGDARAHALADYLCQRAAAFSLSADVTDEQHIARAGMALLDAAHIARELPPEDDRLKVLSEAGRFETMPDHTARFVETEQLRAAVQRPLSGESMTGNAILELIVETAREG
jgi:hypothetical protein